MPEVHALLSASSSKQWLNCPPSARLQENFPNESSVYAEEGTFAHSICEYKVKKYLHERVRRPQSEEFYTEELEQSTDAYYEFVVGVIEEMKRNGCEPLVLVEERVDYSHIAPSGFGTADMLIIGHDAEGRGILHICDYKNGKRNWRSSSIPTIIGCTAISIRTSSSRIATRRQSRMRKKQSPDGTKERSKNS